MTTNYHHILAPTPVATTILNTAPAVVTNMQNHIRAQQDKQNRQTNVIANMSDWRIWESTNLFDNVLLDISNFINNKLAFKFKNKNYTKLEFVDALECIGYSLKFSTALVEMFYAFIGEIRCGQNRVEFRDLGTFRSELRKAITVRNPKTGEKIDKGEYYQPMFKCSDSLRKSMDRAYL